MTKTTKTIGADVLEITAAGYIRVNGERISEEGVSPLNTPKEIHESEFRNELIDMVVKWNSKNWSMC